jgi:hypothetical protein
LELELKDDGLVSEYGQLADLAGFNVYGDFRTR